MKAHFLGCFTPGVTTLGNMSGHRAESTDALFLGELLKYSVSICQVERSKPLDDMKNEILIGSKNGSNDIGLGNNPKPKMAKISSQIYSK